MRQRKQMLVAAGPHCRFLVSYALPVDVVGIKYGNRVEANHQVIQRFGDVPGAKTDDVVLGPDMRMEDWGQKGDQRRHGWILGAQFDFQVLLFAENHLFAFYLGNAPALEHHQVRFGRGSTCGFNSQFWLETRNQIAQPRIIRLKPPLPYRIHRQPPSTRGNICNSIPVTTPEVERESFSLSRAFLCTWRTAKISAESSCHRLRH